MALTAVIVLQPGEYYGAAYDVGDTVDVSAEDNTRAFPGWYRDGVTGAFGTSYADWLTNAIAMPLLSVRVV